MDKQYFVARRKAGGVGNKGELAAAAERDAAHVHAYLRNLPGEEFIVVRDHDLLDHRTLVGVEGDHQDLSAQVRGGGSEPYILR